MYMYLNESNVHSIVKQNASFILYSVTFQKKYTHFDFILGMQICAFLVITSYHQTIRH